MIDYFKSLLPSVKSQFLLLNSQAESENARVLSEKGYNLPSGHARIYFYHIPKAAGSSLVRSIMRSEEYDCDIQQELIASKHRRTTVGGRVLVNFTQPLIEGGDYFLGYSHIPSHFVKLPPDTFTITCFRDPVERVISLYGMNQRRWEKPGAGGLKHLYRSKMSWLGPTSKKVEDLPSFARSLSKRFLLNQLYMFSRDLNVKDAVQEVSKIDHVIFVENYNEGVEGLGKKLGIPLNVRHVNQRSKEPDFPVEDLKEVRAMLELEYEFLKDVKGAVNPEL